MESYFEKSFLLCILQQKDFILFFNYQLVLIHFTAEKKKDQQVRVTPSAHSEVYSVLIFIVYGEYLNAASARRMNTVGGDMQRNVVNVNAKSFQVFWSPTRPSK